MLLNNPFYSILSEYIKHINDQLKNNNHIKAQYESNIKENKHTIDFCFFNIKSTTQSQTNIILSSTQYENTLRFTYNKDLNEIYIDKIPVLKTFNNVRIPIFTSDIALIIKNELKKYTDKENYTIKFSDQVTPLAFDENVKSLIPSFSDTNNYFITNKLLTNYNRELETINKTIKSYKESQDKYIKKMEKIYEQKRKVYGIDPINYKSVEDFHNAVKEALENKINHILKKINRHLKSTEKAYKNILLEEFCNAFNENIMKNDKKLNIEELIEILKRNKTYKNKIISLLIYNELEYIYDVFIIDDEYIFGDIKNLINQYRYKNYKSIDNDIISSSNNDYEILEKCIEILWKHDLESQNGTLNKALKVRKEISGDRSRVFGWKSLNINYCIKYGEYPNYYFQKIVEDYINSFDDPEFSIYECNPNYIPNYNYPLFQKINILLQFHSLMIEKNFYTNVLNNINDYTLDINKLSEAHSSKLQLPYFYMNFNRADILIIKPGCSKIDFENIPVILGEKQNLIQPITYEGKSTPFKRLKNKKPKYNLFLFKKPTSYNFNREKTYFNSIIYDYHKLTITIPASLEYNDIKKLINLYRNEIKTINYICENPSVYATVKSILIDNYLDSLENDNTSMSFISIDPKYYDNYFTTTPEGEAFFKQYNYTSKYKFKRKDIMSIEDYCRIFINRELEDSKDINRDKIKLAILGSYDHKDTDTKDFDEYKYTALNYYIRKRNNAFLPENIHYNKKSLAKDFYDNFGKLDGSVKDIFSRISCNLAKTIFNEDEYLYTNYNNNEDCCLVLYDNKDDNWDNCYNSLEMVVKDGENYRRLSEEEIEHDFYDLGKTNNICVAFYSENSAIIWKNYPYLPLDIEKVKSEEIKTNKENVYFKGKDINDEIPF